MGFQVVEVNGVKVRMVNDRILVRPDEKEGITFSEGGIALPGENRNKEARGTVLAVGPGSSHGGTLNPCSVSAGDRIIYGKFSGTQVKVGNENLLAIRDDDVMVVVS